MEDDSIFIPGQILTVLIALFSYTITHIPSIKKKKKTKLFILIAMSFFWFLLFALLGVGLGFFGGGREGSVFCDRFSLYTAMLYIWLFGDFHPIL